MVSIRYAHPPASLFKCRPWVGNFWKQTGASKILDLDDAMAIVITRWRRWLQARQWRTLRWSFQGWVCVQKRASRLSRIRGNTRKRRRWRWMADGQMIGDIVDQEKTSWMFVCVCVRLCCRCLKQLFAETRPTNKRRTRFKMVNHKLTHTQIC